MEKIRIDINADVGEGIGNEAQLFPLISSCNMACGGHAGGKDTIADLLPLAREYGLKVGAHPSFPDRENFGRKRMSISNKALQHSIVEQLSLLYNLMVKEGLPLHHIKAHGALYNGAAQDEELGNVLLDALSDFKEQSYLYLPYASPLISVAQKRGFKVLVEAFLDRNYRSDWSLVPRSGSNALLRKPQRIADRLVAMVKEGQMTTVDGHTVSIQADTYCIHGDSPNAVEVLQEIHCKLEQNGIYLM